MKYTEILDSIQQQLKSTVLPQPVVIVELQEEGDINKKSPQEGLVDSNKNQQVVESQQQKIEQLRPSSPSDQPPVGGETLAAQKTYKGKKRSDLKDEDFLFPDTRSFPIVSPQDIPDAISNFGRMKGDMGYDEFLRKLYNFAKKKGPAFVAAFPDASKEKLGIKKQQANEMEEESPEMELMEYKAEFLSMNIGSLTAIMRHAGSLLKAIEDGDEKVKENLTESWLQGKIAITEDYMRTIHDFVKYVPEEDDNSFAGDKPGLWENIRKKKEREGKNYKPAKRGDKDRPDPEAWKKAQK